VGQIHTTGTAAAPTGGESHVYQARNVTQQKIPPNITLQPPSGGSTRAPSPRQNRPRSYTNETSASSQPEMSPRSTTGVQWSSTVPLVSSPGGWSSSPTSTRFPVEVSAVDVKWGQLFDDKGVETKRLGQILGGTGQYIVSTFLRLSHPPLFFPYPIEFPLPNLFPCLSSTNSSPKIPSS